MAENRGGARPGAGRTPNADKHRGPIVRFTGLAAEYLEDAFANLRLLAGGGAERVEVKLMPAGLVTRKDVARDASGLAILDDRGKPTVVEVLVYPDKPPDELVPIERKVTTQGPDFKANEYLVDRVLGKPRPEAEPEAERLDLRAALIEAARDADAYRDPDEPDDDDRGGAQRGDGPAPALVPGPGEPPECVQ